MVTAIAPRTAASATIAILAAIGSFISTFSGHPFFAVVLGLAGVLLGVVGLLMAASPRVKGGMLAVGAIILSILGLGLAVLGMIGVVLF